MGGLCDRKGAEMEDHRPHRLGVLLDQLNRAREIAQARLDGLASPASLPEGEPLSPRKGDGPLTDAEDLWEPARGPPAARAGPPRRGRWGRASGCSTAPPATPTRPRSPRSPGGWGTCTPTSPGAGSGPSADGASHPSSWSTSAPRPRWRWSGSGRRWTAGATASRP